MTREDIHNQVIEKYGVDAQINKATEELGELVDELKAIYIAQSHKAVVSEMADVLNCIEQLKIILHISDEELIQEQNFKMNRTLERMKI